MSEAVTTHPSWPSRDWLPIAVSTVGGVAAVRWADFADRRLTEPFFEDSAAKARRSCDPCFTALAELGDAAELADTLQPSGFIFHLSRCGSTLVSQMLAALPSVIAVSEAPPIDDVLRRGGEDMIPILHAIVRALGRRRTPEARHFIVKLDSWHMPLLPIFRRAFPCVPWVFLCRDPVEVMVSHARQPGMQMVPGLHPGVMLGLAPTLDDFGYHVLARICAAALDGLEHGGGRVVDYAALPDAVFSTILPHFGITIGVEERAAMVATTRRHAKRPERMFVADEAAKQADASNDIREGIERHVGGLYDRLLAAAISNPRR
ncbi:MAG: aspartyl/asparaginyl beta-hydroxylase [Sphingomonas bacterium]|nr:aspartyl/asparaginyl beta-hydroxylase [Sphingomonas bacterium]